MASAHVHMDVVFKLISWFQHETHPYSHLRTNRLLGPVYPFTSPFPMSATQMAGQLSYCFRRMSWAATPEAEDYWWRQIQDLGAADARGEITDRKH